MKDSKTNVNFAAIGDKIKNRRVALGLSQEQLAEKCGITSSYIGHIERGSRSLSLNTAISISKSLSISLDYLLLDVNNNDVSALESIFSDLRYHDTVQVDRFLRTVRILAENIDSL